MNSSREDLSFCEHCESVGEVSDVVLGSLVLGFNGFVALWMKYVSEGAE